MTLRDLIGAVEAGTLNIRDLMFLEPHEHAWAWRAFHGSLDAAKALHEALLPGWDVGIDNLGRTAFFVAVYDGARHISAENTDPARAWLLAILRAMEAEGPSRD